ncbi:MAG: hypothetical protein R3281_11865 [Balneolaceae bacterium]|nr:hypothetical protein [Balneolaceae bacterium]
MTTEQKLTIRKLINQTIGGQSTLLKFYEDVLEEDPEDIRFIELTYFAMSVTTIFYLQFGNHTNKDQLLREVQTTVISNSIVAADESISLSEATEQFKQRLSEYSSLIADLLRDQTDGTPIIDLFSRFYEHVTSKDADSRVFGTSKVGKVVSRYIIDNINYIKEEIRIIQ